MGVRLGAWVGLALAIGVVVMGCGSEPATEPAVDESAAEAVENFEGQELEQAAEEATDDDAEGFSFSAQGDEGSISFNADSNSLEMKSGSGASLQIGGNAKLPDDMPDDVPTHEGMKVISVTNHPGEAALMYQAEIQEPVSDVAGYYSDQAKSEGWAEQMNMNQGSEMAMRQYTKDDRMLNIVINGKDGGSVVTITTARQ